MSPDPRAGAARRARHVFAALILGELLAGRRSTAEVDVPLIEQATGRVPTLPDKGCPPAELIIIVRARLPRERDRFLRRSHARALEEYLAKRLFAVPEARRLISPSFGPGGREATRQRRKLPRPAAAALVGAHARRAPLPQPVDPGRAPVPWDPAAVPSAPLRPSRKPLRWDPRLDIRLRRRIRASRRSSKRQPRHHGPGALAAR